MAVFRISGLEPSLFRSLFGASDEELAARGAQRMIVDDEPGFPDRIELRDLSVGESVILTNYTHLDAASPYRSSHALFVREGATRAYDAFDEVPAVLLRRLLSVRVFDAAAMMVDAAVLDGELLFDWIADRFDDDRADFIDVHSAKRGCFLARVKRP